MRALFMLFLLLATPAVAAGNDANPLTADPTPDNMLPPSIEELSFESDGERLSGLLYLANGPGPHPTVILLHGLPGNEKNLDIAQAVRRAGFNVMFFHYRGAWGSEGDYRLSYLVDDVRAALNFLRDHATRYRVDTLKLSLLGHSMGGFAALAYGSKDPSLVCVGAPIRVGKPAAIAVEAAADAPHWNARIDQLEDRPELHQVLPVEGAFAVVGLRRRAHQRGALPVAKPRR